jgi:hypothetical protein
MKTKYLLFNPKCDAHFMKTLSIQAKKLHLWDEWNVDRHCLNRQRFISALLNCVAIYLTETGRHPLCLKSSPFVRKPFLKKKTAYSWIGSDRFCVPDLAFLIGSYLVQHFSKWEPRPLRVPRRFFRVPPKKWAYSKVAELIFIPNKHRVSIVLN